MARKQINLEFYDKKYTIEYTRASIRGVLNDKSEDPIENAVVLVKCGLKKYHEKDMPSEEEIFGWLIALGEDLEEFVLALKELIQDVLDTFQEDRKNLKWGKTEA